MLWSAQWSYFECTVCAVLHVVTEKHMNFIFLFIININFNQLKILKIMTPQNLTLI